MLALATWALAMVQVGACTRGTPGRDATAGSYDVIVVLSDALRADALGVLGNPRPATPYMDGLAGSGLVCRQAYAQVSWSAPSSASLITSTYQSFHQVTGFKGIDGEDAILDESLTTMAEIFKRHGYRTGALTSQYWVAPEAGFGQGFDDFGRISDISDDHETEAVFRAGTDWITRNKDRRFFLYLHTLNPHDPYRPPPPFDRLWWPGAPPPRLAPLVGLHWQKGLELLESLARPGPGHATPEEIEYIRSQYDGEVSYVDWHVGKLMRALERLGIAGKTLVVVTSDHGEAFLEHGTVTHRGAFNEELHIPLIFHNRTLIPKPITVEEKVESIDILPTMVDLLGWLQEAQFQGRSLLRGPRRDFAYSESKYLKELKYQDSKWSLILDTRTGHQLLFDLVHDPGERHDLSASRPEIARGYLEKTLAIYRANLTAPGRPVGRTGRADRETLEQLRALGYLQ